MNIESTHWTRSRIIIFLLMIIWVLSCNSLPLVRPVKENTANVPTISPLATPSTIALKAKEYIAVEENIPGEFLVVVNDYGLGNLNVHAVILQDTRTGGQIYKLLVDLETGKILSENEIADLQSTQTSQAEYGKLQPDLYRHLETLAEGDTVTVAVWVTDQSGKSMADLQQEAFSHLADKYPEAAAAIDQGGKPFDVADKDLARRMQEEYDIFLKTEIEARMQPLVTELERQGFHVTIFGSTPSFTASLPKSVVLELSNHPQVSSIYWVDGEKAPTPVVSQNCQSDVSTLPIKTIEQAEWGGYTGEGYESREPGMMVITNSDEANTLAEWMTLETRNYLYSLDYDTYFVLAVFQGRKPTDGYSILINCLTQQNHTVNIHAQFFEPNPREAKADVETSPYHMIQVQKSGLQGQNISFHLVTNGAESIVSTNFIP